MHSRRHIRTVLPRFLVSVFRRYGLCFMAIVWTTTAQAHEIRPAIVDLKILENARYQMDMRLNLEAIMTEIGPEHSDTSQSSNAGKYNTLRALPAAELKKEFARFQNRFVNGIHLSSENRRLVPALLDIQIPDVGDIDLARDTIITLGGTIPLGSQSLTWGLSESFGANALRVSDSSGADLYSVYLQPGKRSEPIPMQGMAEQSKWQVFNNYVVIGFAHIIPKGLDHILFVVGLFLLSLRMAPLLWQVTSFTIAHSVTLALGILGIVQIPAAIVEPLIALSIVYVGIENILSQKLSKWRTMIIFTFGLLHGLGFASVLSEIGLSSSYFITGLVAFNLGLEMGQLSVIALCFALVGYWFRHKHWYRQRITIPASAVIAAIGAYWFIERALL